MVKELFKKQLYRMDRTCLLLHFYSSSTNKCINGLQYGVKFRTVDFVLIGHLQLHYSQHWTSGVGGGRDNKRIKEPIVWESLKLTYF